MNAAAQLFIWEPLGMRQSPYPAADSEASHGGGSVWKNRAMQLAYPSFWARDYNHKIQSSPKYKMKVISHWCVRANSLQSCLTFCNAMDCSLPGFSVHEILWTRILEWVAIPFSRGSSRPKDRTRSPAAPVWQVGSLLLNHQGSQPLLGTHNQ